MWILAENKKLTLRKEVKPFWKTVPPWRAEPFFSLNNHVGEKMAPPLEVAPFFRRKQLPL